jgi:demethoxyubiquinone hydroxylase (CLK1/Coq7/Cat5 family)
MKDPDRLSEVLQSWQPRPSVQEDFVRQVETRLVTEPVNATTTRPSLLWPLAAGFAVLLGASAGLVQARQEHQTAMVDAYVRSIDPVQRSAGEHSH